MKPFPKPAVPDFKTQIRAKIGEIIRDKNRGFPFPPEAGTYQSMEYCKRCVILILENSKFIPIYQDIIETIITFHEGEETTYKAWSIDEAPVEPDFDEKLTLRVPYGLDPRGNDKDLSDDELVQLFQENYLFLNDISDEDWNLTRMYRSEETNLSHIMVIHAKPKLLELITRNRKQCGERLGVPEFDFKRNKELWVIRGLGMPVYCEYAIRTRSLESEEDSKDPKRRCYKPHDLLEAEQQKLNVLCPAGEILASLEEDDRGNLTLTESKAKSETYTLPDRNKRRRGQGRGAQAGGHGRGAHAGASWPRMRRLPGKIP